MLLRLLVDIATAAVCFAAVSFVVVVVVCRSNAKRLLLPPAGHGQLGFGSWPRAALADRMSER